MQQEQHPHIPSGDWEGFYVYQSEENQKHTMKLTLQFHQNEMKGGGSDDVGPFNILGKYNLKSMTCQFTKQYATHNISYQGQIDENGIWGTWSATSMKGGFHIWPKDQKKASNTETEDEKELVLQEVKPRSEPKKKPIREIPTKNTF